MVELELERLERVRSHLLSNSKDAQVQREVSRAKVGICIFHTSINAFCLIKDHFMKILQTHNHNKCHGVRNVA